MEKRVKKYILRTDRPGKIVPRTAIQNAKQVLGEKFLNASKSFSALRGDLFQDSEQEHQPDDQYKVTVVSVNDKSEVLEVETDDLAEISDEVADLLLPVKASQERYKLFAKREFPNDALSAELGDPVDVSLPTYKNKPKEGEIRW